MKIEECEEIFGKPWKSWTLEEKEEFVSALQIEDLNTPLTFNLAYVFRHKLQTDALAWLVQAQEKARLQRGMSTW